jgi:hypothetical protein
MSNGSDRPRRGPRAAFIAAAVLAACAAAPAALRAQDATNAPGGSARDTEPPSEQRPVFPVNPALPAQARTPLMGLLDNFGLAKPLDDARIRLYGHVEGGYTYNFDDPDREINAGRVFDIEHDSILLNQLTLNVQRDVAINGRDWDVGGRVEMMYGGDARFIHANGMFDNHDDDVTGRAVPGPRAQFDIPQIYADINIPLGNGLRVRAGKFTYFKQIDPNASVFYSHSFTFGAALPFTLTGVYGTYQFNDQWTVDGGFSRGWDQATSDNNGAIDGFGRVKYNVSRDTALAAAFITGPEQDNDNGNWRTAIDVTLSHQLNPDLLLLLDAVYGSQAGANFNVILPGTLGGAGVKPGNGGTAMWYGLSGYAVQRLNNQFSLAGRAEFYRDEEGYTTGVPQTLWEATVGLIITPFPNDPYGQNLKIRPEFRYDGSNKDFYDGFTRRDQWTVAVDAIFNF